MKKSILIPWRAAWLASFVLAAGCAFNGGYNPAYLPATAMPMSIAGKGLVVISDADAAWIYTGHPTSFTGSATTLSLPLGEITKQVALRVFGAAFKDGADFRANGDNATGYTLVVKPKINNFTYSYNQLKNLGFAITPTIVLELHVVLSRPDGSVVLDKTYNNGPIEGASYALSGEPGEKINQLVHQQLFKLMTDAAQEARDALNKH